MSKPNSRLLLVDDEVDFLNACKTSLSKRGFDVTLSCNGYEALECLETRTFDVAILDIKMPGIDGVDLFSRISKRWPELPVIMLTGHGTLEQAFTTSRDGVFDYLSKPMDIDRLAKVCRDAILTSQVNEPEAEADPDDKYEPEEFVRVLVVDDDAELLLSLKRVLERRNMGVETTRSGAAALDLLTKTLFDVIVLELALPDRDGLEVLKAIKTLRPLTEVLILTGHPTVSKAIRGMQIGAFDFFMKPQDPESLARSIRVAFRKKKGNEKKVLDRMVDDLVRKYPT